MSFGGVIVVKLSGVIVREPSVIVMGSNSALPKKGKAVSYNQHGFAWFSQPKKGLSIRFILKFVGSMHIGYISLHLLNICEQAPNLATKIFKALIWHMFCNMDTHLVSGAECEEFGEFSLWHRQTEQNQQCLLYSGNLSIRESLCIHWRQQAHIIMVWGCISTAPLSMLMNKTFPLLWDIWSSE